MKDYSVFRKWRRLHTGRINQISLVKSKIKKYTMIFGTGKSFSEALILVSTNPQYDLRLFIELRVQ